MHFLVQFYFLIKKILYFEAVKYNHSQNNLLFPFKKKWNHINKLLSEITNKYQKQAKTTSITNKTKR